MAIREDTKGRIILTGLQQVNINSVDDLVNALNFGSSIRQTDATAINSKSSRSHAVFSLNLVLKKKNPRPEAADQWVTVDSKLHFVDLAGSERLKNSGLSGERVKEGISINAGLASLGKVISQLSSKNSGGHVSYRDSRLTRLLQDSLGGNAITYMIACVNPVEFHLSETLNTVQYAQRARNIQSRPQVQQRAEEGDKQLVIDRLRSEVAFLRDQIRLSERSERRANGGRSVNENRNQQRENELQNQLLDAQENYSALSQRHAKLISDLAKSKEGDAAMPALKNALGNISAERLDRSNNFAEAVEQVVLEYEKTIQSLESSLSNTRSALATSESNLLEREAKIVYLEAVAQQLQARIQKAMDREADSENYLRDLEAKLEGISNGEDKYHVVISDLRKELQRIRESESSAEEYISTLEERLAEAEQDTDIMQREIKRLEHVIERQRGIGQFDKMMGDLDDLNQDEIGLGDGHVKTHLDADRGSDDFHDQLVATTTATNPNGEMHSDAAEQEWKSFGPMEGDEDGASGRTATTGEVATPATNKPLATRDSASPAQAKAIADKLETVTMELFDLRVDHEATVQELEDTSRKYEIALSTLAELQDAVDESRERPTSFADRDATTRGGDYRLSQRLLSAELASIGRPPTLVDASTTSVTESTDSGEPKSLPPKEESLADAVRRLKRANAEKDINMAELTENYSQLQAQHEGALNYIEELKEESQQRLSQQAHMKRFSTANVNSRRGASIYGSPKDTESKHLLQLRTIGLESFDGNEETSTKFEQSLTAAMDESKTRSDRVQHLEAELAASKKEMELKNTMISGLTRERTVRPVAASNVMDVRMVSSLREQLAASQKQLMELHEASGVRHKKLQSGVQSMKKSLAQPDGSAKLVAASTKDIEASEEAEFKDATTEQSVSGKEELDGTSAEATAEKVNAEDVKHLTATAAGTDDVPGAFPGETAKRMAVGQPKDAPSDLHKDISTWEHEHNSGMLSLLDTQQELLATIAGLEVSLRNAETLHNEREAAAALRDGMYQQQSSVDLEAEKTKHLNQVAALQKEIDGYKSTAEGHANKLGQLESSYAQIIKEVEEDQKTRELTETELRTHRDLVSNLEHQIEQQKTLSAFHQQGLQSVQEAHGKELEELRSTMAAQQAEHEKSLQDQVQKHKDTQVQLEEELKTVQLEMATLLKSVNHAVEETPNKGELGPRIKSIAAERRSLSAKNLAAAEVIMSAQHEAEEARKRCVELEGKVNELSALNEETIHELEKKADKERKSSKMVQELEKQLNEFYEEHKGTQTKLAGVENDKSAHEKTISELRTRITQLEVLTDATRRSYHSHRDSERNSLAPSEPAHDRTTSITSRELKKQNSHQSLPSPPPAVPLPPLPMLNGQPPPSPAAPTSPRSPTAAEHFPSPPASRHTSRHESRDLAGIAAQAHEELELRVRQMEKHLAAERQLTATLEEALGDLETQANRTRADMEAWKKKCREVEEEASSLRKERGTMRNSLQAVEEERDRRIRAEQARRQLEERMEQLGKKGKKGKNTLNCF